MPLFKGDVAMGSISQQRHRRNVLATVGSMNPVPYLVIAVLMASLIWTVVTGDSGWKPEAPDAGVLAMVFGTMFSLVVGAGVMTLVFYDDRRG
jgi:hypothetical protein